jgi:hypothetical protein
MRPCATNSNLPTGHEVKVHLHNECVKWLKELKKDILISGTAFTCTPYLTSTCIDGTRKNFGDS